MVDTLTTSTRTVPHGYIDVRDMGTITGVADFAAQTYAPACVDMIGLFTSCTKKISGFTALGLQEQASCYCCRTSGSVETWTDAIGQYASTCADWASTGEPETAYSVAKTFATFCEQYTDVCDGGSAATSSYNYDSYSTDASATDHNVVTVTGTSISTTTTSRGGGGSKGLSTGAIAGIAAGVGVLALLGLAGLFLFLWKKRKPSPAPAPVAVQQNQPPHQQQFNNGHQQPAVAGGFQPPYNGQQSPPPEMQQYSQVHPDNKWNQNSPVPYQPSPSPQQTSPSPYQTPSPYQPNAAPGPWAAGQQAAGHQPPAAQMHFAAELPTYEMGDRHLPVTAQELPVEDRTRYSELPSGAATQPPHGQQQQ